jgi:hypothetical protein
MENYKSYREQFMKCRENGNLIDVDISAYGVFPKKALVCIKYKCVCHSGVCREERMNKQNDKIHLTNKN